jgi:hypothetical protein
MDTKLTAYSLKPFVVTYPTPVGVFNQFAGGFSLALAGNPNQSVIKDFNGDGRPDIVVGTQSGGLYIFRNTTQALSTVITFAGPQTITGVNIYSLAGGDLDGDSLPDLAICSTGNQFLVYKNVSTLGGSISFSSAISPIGSTTFYSVAINDLDADGRPDVVMGGNTGSAVYIFRNTSNSTTLSFSAAITNYTIISTGYALAVGDIDGDGKPDLVTANDYSTANISILRNTSSGPGVITFAPSINFNSGSHQSRGLSLGDFNGDGKLDIATSNRPNGAVVMVRPNTAVSGTIDSNSLGAYVQLSTAGSYAEAVAIGDINGDGKPDIVSAADNNGSSPAVISVFKNTTTSTLIRFAAYDTYTEATGNSRSEINDVQLADLNNDGLLDVVRTNYNSNNLSIFS